VVELDLVLVTEALVDAGALVERLHPGRMSGMSKVLSVL